MIDDDDTRDLRRLPGLFRRWELAAVLKAGADYRLEEAGITGDGSPLVAVFESTPATSGRGAES